MERKIPEADWKLWKPLFQTALERFCERTLDQAAKFAEGGESAHARYLKLYQYVKSRDKELADIFDEFSRSKAFLQIALAVRKGVVTRTELATFSEETQAVIKAMLGEKDA